MSTDLERAEARFRLAMAVEEYIAAAGKEHAAKVMISIAATCVRRSGASVEALRDLLVGELLRQWRMWP